MVDWTAMFSVVVILFILRAGVGLAALKGRFIQMGDLHFDPTYMARAESCNTDIPAAERGRYGHFECDTPWTLVESAVGKIKSHIDDIDFFVWNGDNIRHVRDYAWLSKDEVLQSLRNITKYLSENLQTRPIFPVLGNHDFYPRNDLSGEKNNELYAEITEILAPFLKISEKETFKNGGYYSRLLDGSNIRVVVLNTNLYGVKNKATRGMKDPSGQYEWFTQLLQNARNNNEKLHVFFHIPPGPKEASASDKMFTVEHNKIFNEIIRNYSDVIIGLYTGHTHTDSFRIYYKDDKPVVPLFVCPSITPWRRITDKMPHNPAIQMFSFSNGPDAILTEYKQYYLDLEKANKEKGPSEWPEEYSFTNAYKKATDVTAASLHDVAEEFKKPGDPTFQDYIKRNSVSMTSQKYKADDCGCICKEIHICALHNVDYDKHALCIDKLAATCAACRLDVIMWLIFIGLLQMFI